MTVRSPALVAVFFLAACGLNEPPHAVTGAIIGGATGAAIGAAAGSNSKGSTQLAASLAGAVVGGTVGAVIGAGIDITSSSNHSSSMQQLGIAGPTAPAMNCVRTGAEVNYEPMQYTCSDANSVPLSY